ncbi:MAG: hypothetical protein OEV22_18865, partial [Deltaproteobacteria bacterium]|nr:hypothetical protein [Deltaproteobacteria bacterium]
CSSVSQKLKKNRAKPAQGKCCLQRRAKKELIFFWYSCQDVNFREIQDMKRRSKYFGGVPNFTSIAAIETFLANYSNAKYMAKRRPQDKRY